jgi:hypothetical protein
MRTSESLLAAEEPGIHAPAFKRMAPRVLYPILIHDRPL